MLHALGLHFHSAGEVIGGNVLTVEVAVRDEDTGVIIVELLDDRGDGIVQLGGDQMAALAGNDLQLAVLAKTGKHGVFHAETLDGLKQLLEIVAVAVNRKGVDVRLFQIGRVERDGKGFALAGDRDRFLILFGGRVELLAQELGDQRSRRANGGGADRLFLFLGRRFRRGGLFLFI